LYGRQVSGILLSKRAEIGLRGQQSDNDGSEIKKRTTVDQLDPFGRKPLQNKVKSTEEKSDTNQKKSIVMPKPITQALMALGEAWNFFSICLYTLIACGFVLNVFGFGYAFTPGGFRVDTIEEFRMENLAKKENLLMHSEHKPPSELPK
jgi:hypothetical protein